MTNDLHHRQLLRRALEAVDQVSAELQSALADRASGAINITPGPLGIGRLLALSRRVDACERISRELSELLDEHPTPNHTTMAA